MSGGRIPTAGLNQIKKTLAKASKEYNQKIKQMKRQREENYQKKNADLVNKLKKKNEV